VFARRPGGCGRLGGMSTGTLPRATVAAALPSGDLVPVGVKLGQE